MRLIAMLCSLLLAGACNEPRTADDADPCGPEDDVVHAGRTAGEAVKTGGTTALEGVKTAGRAVGGLFEGGGDEAEAEWNEGKKETARTAREGAADTKAVAADKPCP